jgi:chromosome segregation ATPase
MFKLFSGMVGERLRARFAEMGAKVREAQDRLHRVAAGSRAEIAALRTRLAQAVQERDVAAREAATAREQATALSARLKEVEAQVPANRELGRLIPFLKNLKREVLDLRQVNGSLAAEAEVLRRENARLSSLAGDRERPEAPDLSEELGRLRRENAAFKAKAVQQEQLIRALKDVETRYKILQKRLPALRFMAKTGQLPGGAPQPRAAGGTPSR